MTRGNRFDDCAGVVVRSFVQLLYKHLPFDAWGMGKEEDPVAQSVRDVINERRWKRFPAWSRWAWKLGLRSLWLVWCVYRSWRVAVRHDSNHKLEAFWRALSRGYLYGERPVEVLAPRLMFGRMADLDVGHLQDRHWLMLWSVVGQSESLRLAQDKRALSDNLASKGFRVPALISEIARASKLDMSAPPWDSNQMLFVKPRHGSRAIGAQSLERLEGGAWRINGQTIWSSYQLQQHLTQLLATDSLLVQPFLKPLPGLWDLSRYSPLELRITTAHTPDGMSVVHSCYLKIQAPGDHSSTILTGALAVPIEPGTGVMRHGLRLTEPNRMLTSAPWNGTPLAGRVIPDYQEIEDMVLRASKVLPGVPVLGWDVLLTDAGPVILEANVGLSWRLMHLTHALNGTASRLPDVIQQWLNVRA